MWRRYAAAGTGLAAVVTALCANPETGPATQAADHAATDLNRAVAIALVKSADARKGRGEFKLVSAQQVVVRGKYVWRLSLKPVRLLPADPAQEAIGAGGEVLVNVDLKTGEAVVTGGE